MEGEVKEWAQQTKPRAGLLQKGQEPVNYSTVPSGDESDVTRKGIGCHGATFCRSEDTGAVMERGAAGWDEAAGREGGARREGSARNMEEGRIWKDRCLSLEASLHKFRGQAGRVKETLGQEMKDLEKRKAEAELRAEAADEKLRVMEQQLAAVNWQPGDFEARIHDLEQQCTHKDQQIADLHTLVEEQRELRQEDARCVEQKAARIKEWVTGKLSLLERQNHDLQMKNEALNAQVEILRDRLQALPALTAKHIHRLSTQDVPPSPVAMPTPPLPAQPEENASAPCSDSVTQEMQQDEVDGREPAETGSHEYSEESSETDSVIEIQSRDVEALPVSVSSSRRESAVAGSRPDSQSTCNSLPHKRPSSSIIEALQIEQELFSYGLETALSSPLSHESPTLDADDTVSGNMSDDSMADIDDPLYHEVDQNHESMYEPKRVLPPQIRIERKIFQDIDRMDSFVSSSNDSEDMLERMQKPLFSMADKPTMPVEPLTRGAVFEPQGHSSGIISGEEDFLSPLHSSPSTLTPRSPRSPLSPLSPQLPDVVSAPTMHQQAQFPVQQTQFVHFANTSSSTVSALATLPRRGRHGNGNQNAAGSQLHFQYEDSVISRLEHQPIRYESGSHVVSAEVHSAPATVARQTSKTKQTTSSPARARFNTWSTKAYPSIHRHRRHQDTPLLEPTSATSLFQDVSVPVYSALKGKARQIRNTPFTEESDDSSEDDGPSEVEGSPAGIQDSPSLHRQQHNHSSSGAIKRGVCRQSSVSEISGDYASPPDNVSANSDSDTSEPEQKLLKYTDGGSKHDTLDNKCGYLSKLGGKVKTWKKRWFVLRGPELFYYKSQHDVLKKPQGTIKLDDQTKISRTHGELTFEITNNKRTYYLSADTYSETDRWVRVLQKMLKRQATSFLLDQVETKAVIKGFLTKVKNGVTRKSWCVLLGGYFLYYRSPSNKTPFGQVHLRDARLEEIEKPSESDDDTDVTMPSKHVIAIWPPYQGPTYLIIPSKQEKDSWLYHLTVAAGGGTGNVGTQYEQLIAKLMQVDGDGNCVYWKHPALLHSKETIPTPLTTLPSKQLQRHAIELFQTVNQFMTSAIESHSLEGHVTLVQTILHTCIDHPQLQNELFCQLIKQTSRHPIQNRSTVQNLLLCGKHSFYLCHTTPTSPTSSIGDLSTTGADCKQNPPSYVISQGWQLLAMCVSLFLPKQSVMWLLRIHLQRNADTRSDIGKYAIFCQRALERTLMKGLREVKPSRLEVMSILLRHPYHHSQPISIPVHFLNNSYQVISFDGSTTVQEFLQTINKSLGMQDCARSGFALYSDDPVSTEAEVCLQSHIKVCDVISRWEETFRSNHDGQLDTSKTIRLLYKNRLYFKSSSRLETDREKLLLTYQVNEEIMNGRFPLNRDLALELASLMAQIEYGDMRTGDSNMGQQTNQALDRFYPRKYRDVTEESNRSLQERLTERWRSLRGRSHQDCVRVYLAVAHKWQFCGAKLFLTRVRECVSPDDIWLAVQEDGVAVLEYSTMQPINVYDFRSVVTFGGWNEDLMLVVTQLFESAPHHYEHRTEKLLFILPKHKVLEATHLIASYINAKALRCSQEANGIVSV